MRRGIGILLLVFAATAGSAHAANGPTTQGYIPMSDGVTLAYQVVLPDPAVYGDGPYPTLFDYSGYGPGRTVNYNLDERFGSLGYAIAGVNIRGTGLLGRQVRLLRGAPGDRRRGGGRVARHTGLERRPDRDGQQVVSRDHAALRRGAAARAPGRDRPGPRLRRSLPRRALPRRDHERDLLRRLEPGRAADGLVPAGAPGRRRGRPGVRGEPGRARRERRATTRSSRRSSTSTTTTSSAPARRTSSPTGSRSRPCWSRHGRTSRSARAQRTSPSGSTGGPRGGSSRRTAPRRVLHGARAAADQALLRPLHPVPGQPAPTTRRADYEAEPPVIVQWEKQARERRRASLHDAAQPVPAEEPHRRALLPPRRRRPDIGDARRR